MSAMAIPSWLQSLALGSAVAGTVATPIAAAVRSKKSKGRTSVQDAQSLLMPLMLLGMLGQDGGGMGAAEQLSTGSAWEKGVPPKEWGYIPTSSAPRRSGGMAPSY